VVFCFSGAGKDCRYLVKWRDLPYAECTWEFPNDIPEGLEDWNKHVDAYWTRRWNCVALLSSAVERHLCYHIIDFSYFYNL